MGAVYNHYHNNTEKYLKWLNVYFLSYGSLRTKKCFEKLEYDHVYVGGDQWYPNIVRKLWKYMSSSILSSTEEWHFVFPNEH